MYIYSGMMVWYVFDYLKPRRILGFQYIAFLELDGHGMYLNWYSAFLLLPLYPEPALDCVLMLLQVIASRN